MRAATADAVGEIVAFGRSGAEDPDSMEAYLRCYYRHVDADVLADRRVEDAFGAAADHARLARRWSPGDTLVEIFNPRVESHGWESPHTVVMVVTDDMPFLVDSVTMEVNRHGVDIHHIVHPMFTDCRDGGGDFVDLLGAPEGSGRVATFIQVEVDKQTDPAVLDGLRADLERVLSDVRVAVQDWPSMRDTALALADELESADLPVPPEEAAGVAAFLRWLADDHFTFLGYREYELTSENGQDALRTVVGSGLGILRHSEESAPSKGFAGLPPEGRQRVRDPYLLNLTKANAVATVHRASRLDYVGVKTFDAGGSVAGERRFLGLYTSSVYSCSVSEVPYLGRTVEQVLARSGFPAGGHAEKDLMAILESYPRDELLQMDPGELFPIAMGIVQLKGRRRVRLFVRRDTFGRYVTCLLYLPRDRYDTEVRMAVQDLLCRALGGSVVDWSTQVSESLLARLFFVVRVQPGAAADVDVADLEARIVELVRAWDDGLYDALVHSHGEETAVRWLACYADGFPANYRSAFEPRVAVADIARMEGLEPGGLALAVHREPGRPTGSFKVKLFSAGERLSLTAVMPVLGNLGVTVVDERPYQVVRRDREPVWIYDFDLVHPEDNRSFDQLAPLFEAAFMAAWSGEVEDDGFNRLVLAAGLGHQQVAILRAYARYLRQIGMPFSQVYVEATLVRHADLARSLLELFEARLDPACSAAPEVVEATASSILVAIDQIASLDEDRMLRRFCELVMATLRTNHYQRDSQGRPLPYLALKLDPSAISAVPEPRPRFEIFVYSPRFEGVHLRSGPVARGGLRWSDRLEDFRTEVLGLLKAQIVKNAVIVPAGAKGGFVVKRSPADRADLAAEVEACYRLFVSALLELTDDLVDGRAVAPAATVRHDGDDSYLVVAADKGTATFSDVANEIAVGRGFWLGDAFASGGSNGYDHKKMGITARGAWESVKRHFRELGLDVQTTDFTVVGIGDMSGDVFGNGMLLSEHTKLVAAFDHRHVFVDPDPDPADSFTERARLFALERSSWADYDTALLSAGGGVYERSAKVVNLEPQARAALGIDQAQLTPDELIRAILAAPVDLLFNGGIGTYVKAGSETHAEVGDKANDAVRVDGRDLRCKVVGEGGNLGVTQLGRVEFARGGGRISTDAIDNSAGVDCSDHEVNIKIVLDGAVADGDLTTKQRNRLLEEMTDEVARLVLADNSAQTQALSMAGAQAVGMVDAHIRYIDDLEGRGLLDRQVERLPSPDELVERRNRDEGLTTPEFAVLLAYTKNGLAAELLASDVVDDPFFEALLQAYFPAPMQERFADRIATHPLRREIVANRIANSVVDRGGTSMVYRLVRETAVPSPEIARAHMVAWQLFDLADVWTEVSGMDVTVPAEAQLNILLSVRQLAERATRWLLRNRHTPLAATATVGELGERVRDTVARLPTLLVGADRRAFRARIDEGLGLGLPPELAERAATLGRAIGVLDITDVADATGADIDAVARVHFAVAERLDLVWLRDRIAALPRDSQWTTLARLTLRGDLETGHRQLTEQVIGRGSPAGGPAEQIDAWIRAHADAVTRYERVMTEVKASANTDLTTLLVASREVRNLIHRATLATDRRAGAAGQRSGEPAPARQEEPAPVGSGAESS